MRHPLFLSAIFAVLIVGSVARADQAGGATATALQTPGAKVTADLALTFKVHQSQKGALMVAIFDTETAYTGDGQPIAQLKLDIASDTLAVVVPGLAPGRYGIKLFHDLNGTGKLTFNMFGIPTEPVAFSNNAKINMRAPTWAEVSFELPASGGAQTIDID